jgi:hypothetical protein
MRKILALAALVPLLPACSAADVAAPAAGDPRWQPFAAEDVIEILTVDEDGAPRETKVWIVVLDDAGYLRTNDSRWLANIRNGSTVRLRAGGAEEAVFVRETMDEAVAARVETAFRAKYGTVQRIMSFFRVREPTVLRATFAEE